MNPAQSTRENYPRRDPQLFYELARERLASQLSAIDSLDNKIGMLVSLASGLIAILAAVFALRGKPFGSAEYTTLSVSVLVYLATSVYGIKAYWTRPWSVGPALIAVWNRLWGDDDDELAKWKTANDFRGYYERNRPAQRMKETALPWILAGVVTQTLCLVLTLCLVAAGA